MMNLDYAKQIPADFNDSSRVWIYQASRLFPAGEALQAEDMLRSFAADWKSHGDPVKGFAHLFFGQFIILLADETATGVSGCSTDSSVHLIRSIEKKFNIQLFDRQNLAFVVKDASGNEGIQCIPLNELDQAFENNQIHAGTLYFNNTVLSKKDLLEKWIIPVKESWLAKRFGPAEITG